MQIYWYQITGDFDTTESGNVDYEHLHGGRIGSVDASQYDPNLSDIFEQIP